jgi:hypothetical protein
MAFINFPSPTPIFPVLSPLTWSVFKKPSFTSTSTKAMTGKNTLFMREVYPRWEFTLKYGDTSWLRDQTQNIDPYIELAGKTELAELAGLYTQCNGAYGEFYYSDPDDCSRANIVLGLGDGVSTIYPIVYTWGTGPLMPEFQAPVTGIQSIVQVTLDGTVLDPTGYSLDATNTKLVLAAAPIPGLIIAISYFFYFRCRFNEDKIDFDQWAKNLWELTELKFKSVKM